MEPALEVTAAEWSPFPEVAQSGLNQSSAGFVVVCRHFAGASSAAGTRVVISMPASSGWADRPWVNAAARVGERMRVFIFMK